MLQFKNSATTRGRGRGRGRGGGRGGRGGRWGRKLDTYPPDDPDGKQGSGKEVGIVVCWNSDRGFGFIKPKSGGEGVFCHVSSITDGNALLEGKEVTYDKEFDDRRNKDRAQNVAGGFQQCENTVFCIPTTSVCVALGLNPRQAPFRPLVAILASQLGVTDGRTFRSIAFDNTAPLSAEALEQLLGALEGRGQLDRALYDRLRSRLATVPSGLVVLRGPRGYLAVPDTSFADARVGWSAGARSTRSRRRWSLHLSGTRWAAWVPMAARRVVHRWVGGGRCAAGTRCMWASAQWQRAATATAAAGSR